MYKIFFTYISFFTILFSSCSKDIGNYDYQEMNSLYIVGIDNRYERRADDSISIIPIIVERIGDNEEGFSYEWLRLVPASDFVALFDYEVFSTERNLTSLEGLGLGENTVYYRVTAAKGIKYTSYKFAIAIRSDLNAGFMVLSEINEEGRLDFVSFGQDQFYPIYDLPSRIGLDLPTIYKPLQIEIFRHTTGPNAGIIPGYATNIFLFSKSAPEVFDPITFDNSDERFNSQLWFPASPANISFDGIVVPSVGSGMLYLFADDNLYYSCLTPAYSVLWNYTLPINKLGATGELFKFSKWIALGSHGAIFDTETRSFYQHRQGSLNCQKYSENRDNVLFPYLNMNHNLVFSRAVVRTIGGVANSRAFAVLDSIPNHEKTLAIFDLDTGEQDLFGKINGPEIEKATDFAIDPYLGTFLYYLSEDKTKVYQYNIGLASSAKEVYKAAPGSKISLIKPMGKSMGTSQGPVWSQNYLMICTIDENLPDGSNGTLEVFNVEDMINGGLEPSVIAGATAKWGGFGKIVNVDFKASN
ncbi:hypothetical protein AwDysgo_18570 [Bacteroidales bacterium]|nr:hypothetical protein AwDysgo_18570 [Bacteroidales bacterium]